MAVKKSSNKNKNKYKNKQKNKINKDTKKKKDLVLNEVKQVKKKNSKVVEKKESKVNNNENIVVGNNLVTSNDNYKSLILIIFILLSLILLVMFFPRIILSGELDMVLSYNESYVEPGYNGYTFKEDISQDVEVVSNINDGVIGDYEVNYYINLFGARVKKTRNVKVVDNVGPIINVSEKDIKICPNEDIPDIDYMAIDEYDGDVTSRIKKIVSNDEILLEVDDLSNNKSFATIKINRVDDEKPVIKLKGNSTMYLTYGTTFKEPGYTANDNCSGELTDKVKVSGTVSRNIGTYELKYEVIDDSGNKVSVTRKVIVGSKIKDNGSVNKGTIYLTFDDGPNQGTTNKILDILKSEGVKATFFVTCKGPDSLIKRMYDEGHTIALHTASHEYSYIYSSVDNYFKDLNKVSDRVKKITGVDSKIIRFPGGSSNTISRNYNKGIMTELTNIVLNQGYRYFDWNVDGMDASSARNSSDVYYNVTSNLSYNKANVVLMHDTKSITVGAIKNIIEFGKEHGYKFSGIDMNTYMVRHKVNN